MTGADKVVCQAATLLLLFTLTTMPAKAQFAGLGGGGGGEDMMTQMAPMLEMMKAKMGKRRFAMMMQTMGPMMSGMMDGSGGGIGGMMGGGMPGGYGGRGMIPGGYGQPGGMGRLRRRRHDGHDGRHGRRRDDEHGPAADAHGELRRRRSSHPAREKEMDALSAIATERQRRPFSASCASYAGLEVRRSAMREGGSGLAQS